MPKPGSAESYRLEEKRNVIGGKTGYADVFMRGVFAWENKAPGKNLDTALKQLPTYSLAPSTPPHSGGVRPAQHPHPHPVHRTPQRHARGAH